MKNTYYVAAFAALAFGATVANADVDIGVTIRGEIAPGVYGRVDLGGRPPPTLVYARPIVIEQPPAQVVLAEPIYLHVPPEHARAWRLHCREYHACDRRVYFVRSAEYEPDYAGQRGIDHDEEDYRRDEYARQEERERYEESRRRERHERREERREEHGDEHAYRDYEHDHDNDHGHDHDHERDHDHEHEHDHD